MKDYDFSGKVALVTGSSGGLGIEVARAFLKVGASVILTYHSSDSLQSLQKIGGVSKNIFLLRGDFTKEDDVKISHWS